MTSLLPDEGEHLTTGWEPELDAADSVARQAVLAHASWAVTLARHAGRRWHDGPEWAAGHGHERNAFSNWVVIKQPLVDFARVVTEVDELLPAGTPYIFVSPWPTPDLRDHRLALAGHPPLMLRVPSTPTAPLTSALELRWVASASDLVDAEGVLVEGYPVPELQPFTAGSVYAAAALDGATKLVVAYDGDQPLATAAAHSAHGVTLVENMAAMAAARGRGAGAAVTWAATTAFPGQPAVLIASDDGQPVYQRLGYLRVERWTVWIRAAG